MRRLVLFMLCLISPAALAGVVLDQYAISYNSVATLRVGGLSEQKLAQTFEAGVSGRLDRVVLVFTCTAGSTGLFTVEIQNTGADGLPDGSVLGSVSLDSSTLTLEPVTFRDVVVPGVDLVAGTQYAIVMRADDKASCLASEGPVEGGFFHYPRGSGYFDARPNPPGWTLFVPQSRDLPFYTYMRVADLTGPLYCAFEDASGMPNDWLPNHVPVCGCLSDRGSRANRCWFTLPGFTLWRDVEPFGNRPDGKVRWNALPFDSAFPGVRVEENGIDGNFVTFPLEFPAGLRPGKPSHQNTTYSGVSEESFVSIRFPGPSGMIDAVFRTKMEVPSGNGQ